MNAFSSYADGPIAHAAYRMAVGMCGPDHPDTLNLRALVELRQGDARRSLETCLRAIQRDPKSGELWQCLGWIRHELGQHAESLAAYRRASMLSPEAPWIWPSMVWSIDMSEFSTEEMRAAVRADMERLHIAPHVRRALPYMNDPTVDRQLRIGYVSADFYRHSAAFTFSLPLRHHDRDRFKVYVYDATEHAKDGMTDIMRAAVDVWREVYFLDDDRLAAQIRADKIDILVDLAGVTSGSRLFAFARRPAPVQILGWGYAPGLGLSSVDYLLSDEVVIPPEHASRHREELLYLPALLAADFEAAGDPLPELVERPMDRPFTFGYFGRVMKVTDHMLSVWARVLRAVPDSVLLMKMADLKDMGRKDHILEMFVGLGVDGRRIRFLPETTRGDHLKAHNLIDVAFDSAPVGGGTTTLDTCAMGVPLVTKLGDTPSSRIAASVVSAIGRQTWAVSDDDAYVRFAVNWARCKPSFLLRREIRARFLDSIMCDGPRYTRALEYAYHAAWEAWCDSAVRTEAVV